MKTHFISILRNQSCVNSTLVGFLTARAHWIVSNAGTREWNEERKVEENKIENKKGGKGSRMHVGKNDLGQFLFLFPKLWR